MKIDISPANMQTVRLALMGWAARCDEEARTMLALSANYDAAGELHRKCLANVEASKAFAREAREVLEHLP